MEKDINTMFQSNLKKNMNMLQIDWVILNSLALLQKDSSNQKKIYIILLLLINLLSKCQLNIQVNLSILSKEKFYMKIQEFWNGSEHSSWEILEPQHTLDFSFLSTWLSRPTWQLKKLINCILDNNFYGIPSLWMQQECSLLFPLLEFSILFIVQ